MRLFFTLILGFFTMYAQAQTPPVNDDCAGLIDLGTAPSCDQTVVYTNVGATLSNISTMFNVPACFQGGNPERDVWFRFTPPTDGSIVDFTITIAATADNGIVQPQVALYRGNCAFNQLQELGCASSAPGETSVTLEIEGLTPTLDYFLRVNDYSASATPNWGDFTVCVDEPAPIFTLGTDTDSGLCNGTLYDSGGPDGDYGNGELQTFTICPNVFAQCINLNFTNYALENGFDFVRIYAGDDTTAPLYFTLNGTGADFDIPVPSTCVTIELSSDGSVTDAGFEMTWACSQQPCDVPPISSCDEPTDIPALPYSNADLSTCFAGNTLGPNACTDAGFLNGDEVVFTYTSPGDECVSINVGTSSFDAGIAVFSDCPTEGGECLTNTSGFGTANPSILAVEFEDPGTYYIVVGTGGQCADFSIDVETVECPNIFPPAGFCADALSINGCEDASGGTPAIVSVELGPVEEDFVSDLNETCWFGPGAANFTFFFFQAATDGNFGFTIQSQNPAEASDVDFLVWGPVASQDELCDYAMNNQADRCSYAAGADPTGLADIHPVLGIPVTDVSEGAGGDDFVSTLPVEEGSYYLVLINDFGGNITSGAAVIDFGATSAGVLGAADANFQVSADTAVCENQPVQLMASGGDIYEWFPGDGLSCDDCPNPIATVTESTTYNVEIRSLCAVDTLSVEVEIFQLDAGPDQTVCLNETTEVNAGSDNPNATYVWTGPAGTLSCTDCPDPTITSSTPGQFTYTVSFSADGCNDQTDELVLTVLPVEAAEYAVIEDASICAGEDIMIGTLDADGTSYMWTSNPPGFTSDEGNPTVSPTVTTTYYLTANNLVSNCPQPSTDSVVITVNQLPVIDVADDVTICEGESVVFGMTIPENDVTYTITPDDGVSDPTDPNSVLLPTTTTEYTLTATRGACSVSENLLINVIDAAADFTNPDSTGICLDETIVLNANIDPPGAADVVFSNSLGETVATGVTSVSVTPADNIEYYITVTNGNCVASDTIKVRVDSVPSNMMIMPVDTTVCQGELVTLFSPLYEPFMFEDITHLWQPSDQLITPDSLYQAVIQATDTTTFTRTTTNGFCSTEETVTVNVIPTDALQILPMDPVLCPGESVQLTLDLPAGAEDIEWMGAGLSCTDCPDPIASPTTTTTYTVSVEFMGCPLSGSITVEVAETPSVSFPDLDQICLGDVLTLNTNPNQNWTYVWSSTDPDFDQFNSPAPTVSPDASASYTVSVQADADCPAQTFTFDLTVINDVQVSLPAEVIFCTDEIGMVTAQGTVNGVAGGGTYEWFLDGAPFATGMSIDLDLDAGMYTLSVEFTDNADCLSGTATTNVTVGTAFDVSIESDQEDQEVFQGSPIVLTATVEPAQPGASIVWFANDQQLPGVTGLETTVQPTEAGTVTYTIEVTSAEGCTRTASITFSVIPPEYEIPNVVTANNDGMNDSFGPVIMGGVELTNMRIFNRWGQLVYEGTGDWDITRDGKLVPQDVYVYLIELTLPDGTTRTEEGDVTVIR